MVQTSAFSGTDGLSNKQIACLRSTCVALREHSRREYAALEQSVEAALLGLQRENAELELIASQWRRCCAEQEWACIKAREEVGQAQARVRELEEKMQLMDILYAEEQSRWQQTVASLEAEVGRLRKTATGDGSAEPTSPEMTPKISGGIEKPGKRAESGQKAAVSSEAVQPLRASTAYKRSEPTGQQIVAKARPGKRSRSRTTCPPSATEAVKATTVSDAIETRVQEPDEPERKVSGKRPSVARRRRRVSFSSPGAPASMSETFDTQGSAQQSQIKPLETAPTERIVPVNRQKAPDLHFQRAQQGRRKLFSFITQQRLIVAKPRPMPTLSQL
jgi:hypothetical protein